MNTDVTAESMHSPVKTLGTTIRQYEALLFEKLGIKRNHMILYTRDATDFAPVELPIRNLTIGVVREEDLPFLSDVKPALREKYAERLRNGHTCIGAWINNKIVARGWISMGKSVYVPEIERAELFGEGEAYLWDAVVLPRFRGMHLQKKLIEGRIQLAREKNCTVFSAFVKTTNIPSRKNLEQMGFYKKKYITFTKFAGYRHYREEPAQ